MPRTLEVVRPEMNFLEEVMMGAAQLRRSCDKYLFNCSNGRSRIVVATLLSRMEEELKRLEEQHHSLRMEVKYAEADAKVPSRDD